MDSGTVAFLMNPEEINKCSESQPKMQEYVCCLLPWDYCEISCRLRLVPMEGRIQIEASIQLFFPTDSGSESKSNSQGVAQSSTHQLLVFNNSSGSHVRDSSCNLHPPSLEPGLHYHTRGSVPSKTSLLHDLALYTDIFFLLVLFLLFALV